jgi:hypothetical protein
VVGDTAYRWTVRRRQTQVHDDGRTLLPFVVEQATGQGALLIVTVPGGPPSDSPAPVPTAEVAASITRALTGGWRPASRGPASRCRSWVLDRQQEPRSGRPPRPVRRAGPRRTC